MFSFRENGLACHLHLCLRSRAISKPSQGLVEFLGRMGRRFAGFKDLAVEAEERTAGAEEGKNWAHRTVLSRMPELCPENTSAVVSGMSTHPGGPREQLGTTGSLWPSEPIILGPEESARQLVLRKIQELTIAVRREGESHPFLAGTYECFPGYSLEAIRLGFPRACAGVLSKLCCSVPSALGFTLNHTIVWG